MATLQFVITADRGKGAALALDFLIQAGSSSSPSGSSVCQDKVAKELS
jgi:hypothetical protein